MPIPTGQLTRQQIRDLALNRAGNRALEIDATAWLSQILYDLATLYDFPQLMRTTTLTITGRQVALPSLTDGEFYQAQDDASLMPVTWDNVSVAGGPLLEVDRQTFDLQDDPNSIGRPSLWTVDRMAGVAYVTPNPAGHVLVAQLRYKAIPYPPAPADEPTDIPWFPWSSYLVQALYVQALEHERDPRLSEGVQLRDQLFAMIRRGSSPRHAQATTIPLDPAVFRAPFRGD